MSSEFRPLVSILIPAYNARAWIAGTIRSALNQTWPNKEIIIVDDGSRDDTLEVARRFASEGVSVVAELHRGAASSRNKAFALSKGDYIQWLDADDLLTPDKIERQLSALNGNYHSRILLSSPWARFAYRSERARAVPTALWQDLEPVEWLLRKMGQNLFMQTGTWLTSREVTKAAGPWDPRLLSDDDGEFFCRILLETESVRFVPGGGVLYRDVHLGSLSFIGMSDEKMDAMLLSVQLHIKYLMSLEDSPRIRKACLDYMQRWMNAVHPRRKDIVEELQAMAGRIGGTLDAPHLRWKYAWMRPIVGHPAAWRAQLFLPHLKARLLSEWDRLMSKSKTASGAGDDMRISGDK
jgi:glycosyltransferase involved in cell wall biosynthesis